MNTPRHQCCVPDCPAAIPTHLLMCYPHWKQVPPALQQAVYAAFRKYQRGNLPLDDLRAVQARATAAVTEGGAR